MGFAFEYDSRKAASNLKKHGVSFREAMTVFDDPMAQTFPDDLHSEDESRSITIGLSSRHSLYIRLSLVSMRPEIQSAAGLRRELSARNLARAETVAHEATYGAVPSVLYAEDEAGGHGNFLAASYKRICADPQWRLRLEKSYTANARVPRAGDRRRKELDCCASSDALLMNIFCTPR
ncbi:MAG TPA: BrnT family toxin, partial [Terracidiphilus sp.]|nr:BrnT family toxin [Terracidiphilus sp.]